MPELPQSVDRFQILRILGKGGMGTVYLARDERLQRPLEAAEFMSIARQIAGGVAAAHDGGVIHRDLKPANIIIEPTGQVKILDFGLAKALQQNLTATQSPDKTSGMLFGTLHYLSPEQARGATADER